MDKKLKKYIERYDVIQDCATYELKPNGGMIVLINQEIESEVLIENCSYELSSFQAVLINAYEASVNIRSNNKINLTAIRFRGAGASFFYEKQMTELMQVPKEPIFIARGVSRHL